LTDTRQQSPEDLKAAFASLSESAVSGPDCPAPGEIWDCATGRGPGARASAIVDHTSRCFACAEAWRLARELSASSTAAPGSEGAAPASRAAGAGAKPAGLKRSGLGRWTALAAMVTLLAAAGVVLFRRTAPPDVMRAGDEVVIRSLVPESEPLRKAACVLKWSEPVAGARYTVRVGAEDLSPIALAENLERAEYTLEPKALEKLPPGSAIVWRVEAVLPDGRRIASPGFRNRLE